MATSRFLLPAILGALLLGAVGLSLAQRNETRSLQDRLAALEKERDELGKRVTELQKLNSDLAARTDRGSRPAGETERPGPGRRQAPDEIADAAGRGRQEETRFANIMNRPEVQQMMAAQQKAGLDGRYAALFRKLGLNPADLEKFKNLLVERQSAMSDVMTAARNQGMTGRENRDELRQLVQQTQAEVDDSIREMLGENAYAQYKNYEATLPQRGMATQLEQRLSYTSTPLAPNQVEQLVQILHDNAPAASNRNPAVTAGPAVALSAGAAGGAIFFGGGPTRITDAALAQAQGVLSAPQLAALQALQQEQQAAAQLSQQFRNRIERTAEPKAEPPRG